MKNLGKKIAILALSFVSFLGVQSASAMEGFSVGVAFNQTAFMGTGKETMTGSGGNTTKTKITEEEGAFEDTVGSIFGEYAANDKISIGIEMFLEDVKTPENLNIQQTKTTGAGNIKNRVKASFEDHTTLYANINLAFGTYLKLGYVMVDVATQESLATGSKYGNVNTNGYTVGLGYQYNAPNGVFVRGEISATDYDDVSATSTTDSSKQIQVNNMYGAIGALKIGKSF
tara:strand:+ start:721 stop:1407 length:687 start_codon:yes stop_codon:yes gene_type:complete